MKKRDKVVEREYPKKCPECGSKNIVTGKEEIYCADCGLVIKDNIVDFGPERRVYDEKQVIEKIRTGPPLTCRIYNEGLKIPIHESFKKKKDAQE